MRIFFLILLAIAWAQSVLAATRHVPGDHKTIQAAIDVSQPDDTVLVAPSKYQEHIRLKPGVLLRSEGDDAKSAEGLKRAEATIISPILRNNACRNNKMAGIGCRDRARPLIVNNDCRENELAGIGVKGKAVAVIQGNRRRDNKLVAIGVIDGSTATILDNELLRKGGPPPIVAVKDGSTAAIRGNRITGGGVAAVLVQGQATLSGNTFTGIGAKHGSAVWVWENSAATISRNSFHG